MTKIVRALPWAIAMILLAVGERYGLIERSSASTMFIILPILALMSIIGPGRCFGPSRGDKGACNEGW